MLACPTRPKSTTEFSERLWVWGEVVCHGRQAVRVRVGVVVFDYEVFESCGDGGSDGDGGAEGEVEHDFTLGVEDAFFHLFHVREVHVPNIYSIYAGWQIAGRVNHSNRRGSLESVACGEGLQFISVTSYHILDTSLMK